MGCFGIVIGYSRSLEIAPFDRAHTSSCREWERRVSKIIKLSSDLLSLANSNLSEKVLIPCFCFCVLPDSAQVLDR